MFGRILSLAPLFSSLKVWSYALLSPRMAGRGDRNPTYLLGRAGGKAKPSDFLYLPDCV
jgi:hypothetical protein